MKPSHVCPNKGTQQTNRKKQIWIETEKHTKKNRKRQKQTQSYKKQRETLKLSNKKSK